MIELKEPPKIDLAQLRKDSPDYKKTIREIKQAALDPGFFCLENISEKQADLFENTKKQMDVFFSLEVMILLNWISIQPVQITAMVGCRCSKNQPMRREP